MREKEREQALWQETCGNDFVDLSLMISGQFKRATTKRHV